MNGLRIIEDDLTGEAIAELLAGHLANMHAVTPRKESVHAMPIDALRSPLVTFWSAWLADELVGCGALKQLSPTSGEIKSMRTVEHYRRRGVGAAVLEHILTEARRRRYDSLYLETGSNAPFQPARDLYTRYGFRLCGPFGDYIDDPNSVFMTMRL